MCYHIKWINYICEEERNSYEIQPNQHKWTFKPSWWFSFFRGGVDEDGRKGEEKSWGTRTETFKPLTCYVLQGHRVCLQCLRLSSTLWETLTSSHEVPAGKKTACTSRQTAAERHSAQTADTAVDFMLCQYSFLQSPLSAPGGLQKRGCPGTIYYSCDHYLEW